MTTTLPEVLRLDVNRRELQWLGALIAIGASDRYLNSNGDPITEGERVTTQILMHHVGVDLLTDAEVAAFVTRVKPLIQHTFTTERNG